MEAGLGKEGPTDISHEPERETDDKFTHETSEVTFGCKEAAVGGAWFTWRPNSYREGKLRHGGTGEGRRATGWWCRFGLTPGHCLNLV